MGLRERGRGGGALIGDKRCDRRLRDPGRPAGAQEGIGVVGVGGTRDIRGATRSRGSREIGVGGMRAGRRQVLAIKRGAVRTNWMVRASDCLFL